MTKALDFTSGYASRRPPMLGHNAVATSQPLAAQAGMKMLQLGGNAVDAAIAAAMALTVVEPTGNGIGSDAFAIVWDGEKLHGLNASGRSPASWHADLFAGKTAVPEIGWDAVTVPGAVSGWVALAERFGTLPLTTLAQPAIDYARNGFPVSPLIGHLWQRGYNKLKDQPGFSACFAPEGRAPRVGEIFRNPAQANSLELIARTNGEAFYRGELAQKIAAFAREHGAHLTAEDLANHRVDWVELLSRDFAGGSVQELPPNGQGIATLIALGILEQCGIEKHHPDSVQSLHLSIEAMKLALADLDRYVADEAHMAFAAKELLSDHYLKSRAALINHDSASDFVYGSPTQSWHGLHQHRGRQRDDGLVYSVQLYGLRFRHCGAGYRDQPAKPGLWLCAGSKSPERAGGEQASVPHHHSGLCDGRQRPAADVLRRDGRPDAGAGAHADGATHHAARAKPAGGNRCAALARGAGQGGDRESTFDRNTIAALRERGASKLWWKIPLQDYNFGGAQVIYRLPEGHYVAATESRKDGQALVS